MDIKLSDLNPRRLSKLDLSSLAELYGELTGGKKIVVIAVICFFIITVLIGILYLGGSDERKRQEVQKAFEQMSRGRAKGEVSAVASSISTTFNDAGLGFGSAVKYFSAENPGYLAVIENIAVKGEEALVSYKRMETVNGKRKITSVINETWIEEDGKWVLGALSEADRLSLKSLKLKTKTAGGPYAGKPAPDELAVTGLSSAAIAMKEVLPPYTSAGKRDPFKSLVIGFEREGEVLAGGTLETCDADRKKEFLESFDLMSVNLVGIIGGERKFALVETPNGNGYTVKKGMHIGRNCGKIIEIRPDRMFVEEKYPGRKTGIRIVKRELKLRQDEE